MQSCVWFWDNVAWVESPQYPHNCPPGQECDPPTGPGVNYGDQVETSCKLPGP